MRVFLAVDVDDRVRAGIRALIERLREPIDRAAAAEPHRLGVARPRARDAALHRGAHRIARRRADRRREAAARRRALRSAPWRARTVPAARPPRVLWVGVERGSDGLGRLHEEMGKRLLRARAALEERAVFAARDARAVPRAGAGGRALGDRRRWREPPRHLPRDLGYAVSEPPRRRWRDLHPLATGPLRQA